MGIDKSRKVSFEISERNSNIEGWQVDVHVEKKNGGKPKRNSQGDEETFDKESLTSTWIERVSDLNLCKVLLGAEQNQENTDEINKILSEVIGEACASKHLQELEGAGTTSKGEFLDPATITEDLVEETLSEVMLHFDADDFADMISSLDGTKQLAPVQFVPTVNANRDAVEDNDVENIAEFLNSDGPSKSDEALLVSSLSNLDTSCLDDERLNAVIGELDDMLGFDGNDLSRQKEASKFQSSIALGSNETNERVNVRPSSDENKIAKSKRRLKRGAKSSRNLEPGSSKTKSLRPRSSKRKGLDRAKSLSNLLDTNPADENIDSVLLKLESQFGI